MKKIKRGKGSRQFAGNLYHRRFPRIYFLLGLFFLCWLLFAPGMGLFAWKGKRAEIQSLRLRLEELEQQNKTLRADVERWKNDPEYFQKMAHDKYNCLREDETVIQFDK